MDGAQTASDNLNARLRRIAIFADLEEDHLNWLASHLQVAHFEAGALISEEGSVADRLMVILDGEIVGRKEKSADDGRIYSAHAGQVTGMLPYSRLTHYPLTTRAVAPTTAAFLDASWFPEMLKRVPVLGGRLVGVMADRIRESARSDQQREKLISLGKLSAGLAHELNNPASAVRNAASALQQAVAAMRSAALHLDKRELPTADRAFLARLECDWHSTHPQQALDSLDRSDREEEIGSWLETHRIPEAHILAAALVDAGCDLETLRTLAAKFDDETLALVVTRLASSFTITHLVQQIESGTARISNLVKAVKQYSYMDQTPEQEIDLHDGIENTLVMLHYRLKLGIRVIRQYDRAIPRVCAYASELNQVWTNLIDNAIDAMAGNGELTVRTAPEGAMVLVEIRDNGPGIPAEIQDRIFDPFFTTKGVGEGTGLGLDAVFRIVQKHHGSVRVNSKPGRTSFEVRLPIAGAGKGENASL